MFVVQKTMLTIDAVGLKFGEAAILAKLSPDGRLDVDRNEGRILTLLGAAYGGQMPDWVIVKIRNAASKWNAGQPSLAVGLLTEMRMRDVDDGAALERVSKVEHAFDAGLVSEEQIQMIRKGFDPSEARDWHGRWTAGNSSAGSGAITSPGASDEASSNGSMQLIGYTVDHNVPADAVQYQAGDNSTFYAPPDADFSQVYTYGLDMEENPTVLDPVAIGLAVGHGGLFDFQRSNGVFYPAYTNASNYAVGVLMRGAGYSLSETLGIGSKFAEMFSSNAGDETMEKWWILGWDDADRGRWVPSATTKTDRTYVA